MRDEALVSWWAASPVLESTSANTGPEWGISLASHPLAGPRSWTLALGRSWGPRLPVPTPQQAGVGTNGDGVASPASRQAPATRQGGGANDGSHRETGGYVSEIQPAPLLRQAARPPGDVTAAVAATASQSSLQGSCRG